MEIDKKPGARHRAPHERTGGSGGKPRGVLYEVREPEKRGEEGAYTFEVDLAGEDCCYRTYVVHGPPEELTHPQAAGGLSPAAPPTNDWNEATPTMRKRDLIDALEAIPGDDIETQVQSGIAADPHPGADTDALHAHAILAVFREEMPDGPRVFIEIVRNYDIDGNELDPHPSLRPHALLTASEDERISAFVDSLTPDRRRVLAYTAAFISDEERFPSPEDNPQVAVAGIRISEADALAAGADPVALRVMGDELARVARTPHLHGTLAVLRNLLDAIEGLGQQPEGGR